MQNQQIGLLMAEFPSDAHLYYAIYRCFRQGSTSRPPLLPELVIYIFEFAGMTEVSVKNAIAMYNVPCTVISAGPPETEIFLCTRPVTKDLLPQLCKLRVETVTRDQGWADDPSGGSWSSFEVAIMETDPDSGDYKPKRLNTRPQAALVWHSHHNRQANSTLWRVIGPDFTRQHELWDNLAAGDIIAVQACAQFAGWANFVHAASLRVWKRFDPRNVEGSIHSKAIQEL